MLISKIDQKIDGQTPEADRAYHKSHISKTIGIDIVGMDFESILENGGRSINIVLQRNQSAKVRHRKLVAENGVIIKYK